MCYMTSQASLKAWGNRRPFTKEEDPDGTLTSRMTAAHKEYRSLYETIRQKGSATERQVELIEEALGTRGAILREAAMNKDRDTEKQVQKDRKETDDVLGGMECAAEKQVSDAHEQLQRIKRLRAPLGKERSSADQRVEDIFSSAAGGGATSSGVAVRGPILPPPSVAQATAQHCTGQSL